MKCPKCGFVSFPGLDQCKKCGHRFTYVEDQKPGAPPLFSQASSATTRPADAIFREPEGKEQIARAERGNLDRFIDRGKEFPDEPERGATETGKSGPTLSMDWQKELSERMQEYRRRRARISSGKEDDEKTLALDFKSSADGPDGNAGAANVIQFPSFGESNVEEDTSPDSGPNLDAFVPDGFSDQIGAGDAEESSTEQIRMEPPAPAAPMEIELESSQALNDVTNNASYLVIAPMGRRFLAGVFDLLVLLLATGVFAAIFLRAGGQFSSQPLDLVVVALAGILLLMAYFGVFTVFAYGTPGLIWAGLEVRTFEGNPPKRIDCFWRSFGYIVSTSALMLGFIWALVDGDGLTWHDRMSRTLLVRVQSWGAFQAAESDSQWR